MRRASWVLLLRWRELMDAWSTSAETEDRLYWSRRMYTRTHESTQFHYRDARCYRGRIDGRSRFGIVEGFTAPLTLE
ncbi:hypothetical protein C8Q80DRAFT_1211058 [Daedaleopsis nitida]|nr:hypothetical protein C8Q80DRAFT_1211058 [Daedaleopsis nitida]